MTFDGIWLQGIRMSGHFKRQFKVFKQSDHLLALISITELGT